MKVIQNSDYPEPEFFRKLVAKDIELHQRTIEELRWEDIL